MKPYGKILSDSSTCRYGCCGNKLHRYSSGHDRFKNRNFKRAARSYFRGKARSLNRKIVTDGILNDD